MEEPPVDNEQSLLPQLPQDLEAEAEIISSQVRSQSASEKPNEQIFEADACIRNDSVVECNFYARKDTEARILHVDILRSRRIFPVFDNAGLSRFSANYFLYFEFYHMAIRILFGAFLVSLGGYGIYYIVMTFTSDDNAIDTEALLFIVFVVVISISLVVFRYLETRHLLKNSILYEYQWSEDLFSLLIEGLPEDTSKEEITNYLNTIFIEKGAGGAVKSILLLQDPKLYTELKKKLVTINKALDTAGEKEGSKEVLLGKKERIEIQLNTLRQELAELKHFKGKAIVTFDLIEAKEGIRKHFEVYPHKANSYVLLQGQTSKILFKRS